MTDGPVAGLISALARCQAKFPAIVKAQTAVVPTKTGGKYEYSYADLAVILAAVRPVLAEEGIVVTQSTLVDRETGAVELITSLMWGDAGESLSSSFPLHIAGLNAQGVGSLMTYYRRYQLCAILGVHPEGEDDDGSNAATAQTTAPKAEQMPTVMVPADWKTRPLAQMTFQELRAVAFELNHPFSGGSKSELIRQLEPLVRAASGEDAPFMTPPIDGDLAESGVDGADAANSYAARSRPEPEAIPFNPTVANAGSVRRGVNSATKAES